MTVEVTYEGAAVVRGHRLGVYLTDADLEVDTYLADQLTVALEAQGVPAGLGVKGTLRLRCEFSPEAK